MPEWADPRELDPEVRRDLRGLSKEGSEFVAGHLFMAGMLAEEDPALAWRHARAARSKGGRIAVVRETVGLVAYRAGEWAEAIAELRAARRMSGGPGQLPVMADCERALGHPEKAIELSRSAEAAELDPSSAAELKIVVAGARADMGQLDAALANLESAVRTTEIEPYTARLFYAYADLLLQADRRDEAIEYFMKAADVDVEEETDAGDRLTELADEEADLSGIETTDFVADDDDDDDDDDDVLSVGEPSAGSGDIADSSSTPDPDGTNAVVGSDGKQDEGLHPGRSGGSFVDGGFQSDPDEQDKLLMTADDDEFAEPEASATGAGAAGAVTMSVDEADDLDRDDLGAQEATEDEERTEDLEDAEDGGGPGDAAAADGQAVPDPVLGLDVTETPQPPARPAIGSLFSHHEGGL